MSPGALGGCVYSSVLPFVADLFFCGGVGVHGRNHHYCSGIYGDNGNDNVK